MGNKIFKNIGVVFILAAFVFTGYLQADGISAVSVSLIYPQKSNAPKREMKKKEAPVVLNGEVLINIAGVDSSQLKKTSLRIEYFMDDVLFHSAKEGSWEFILDTAKYVNGPHKLVVNLWDKDGPSAIGIRELVIQNGKQTK